MTFREDLAPRIDPFRTIGSLASGTADLPDDDVQREREQEEGEGLEHPVQQIESLCMNCQENVSGRLAFLVPSSWLMQGMTRLLLTTIPHFREGV
jgi:hypothetical protein